MSERHFWLRLGWRNLGRHRRRSVITAIALAWGFAAVVVLGGIMKALTSDFIRNGTDLVLGQIRIQNPSYEPERELWDVVGGDGGVDLPALLDRTSRFPGIVGAAPRVYGAGIVASDSTSRGAMLMGIDPDRETGVTRFLDHLVEGALPGPGRHEVLLGDELARQIRARPGHQVILVAPSALGGLGNEFFTVSGIFRTGIAEFDANQAVLRLEDLQGLLALGPGEVHEIAAAAANPWNALPAVEPLGAALADLGPAVQVTAWNTYRPELVEFAALVGGAQWVILVIVFVMAAFGVANTMLMGTFERRREFAVLKAMGMRPGQVLATVVSEALVLGALALVAGSLFALPIMFWLGRYPLDLTSVTGEVTYGETLYRMVLRVEPAWEVAAAGGLTLFLSAVLAALYPAYRANRVPAAEALAGR